MLQCCYCAKQFKYESERKRHEQSHFPQFECKECCKKFSFLSALRRHQKQHERTGSVQCTDCGRNFRDDTLLKRHIKYAHKGTFICSKCNAKFSSELALNCHLKTHKAKSERRYHCSFDGCSKSFNFSHHLKHHELAHTNAKQHYCNICGKGFIQSHHLKSHMRSHEPENFLLCTVPHCNKKFPTEYSRKRHLETHKHHIDSGISSDSNCDEKSQDCAKETILCASCGQIVNLSLYDDHEALCVPSSEVPQDLSLRTMENIDFNRNRINQAFSYIENELYDNSFLNLHAEINSFNLFDPYKENNNSKPPTAVGNSTITANTCESCVCSNNNVCDYKNLNSTRNNNALIEYQGNGAIKLKNTFDDDIQGIKVVKTEKKDFTDMYNDVPYNSCKAVLGKCIVSGNGMISEECLCAKMAIDDQQIVAQEIDEITPQPL